MINTSTSTSQVRQRSSVSARQGVNRSSSGQPGATNSAREKKDRATISNEARKSGSTSKERGQHIGAMKHNFMPGVQRGERVNPKDAPNATKLERPIATPSEKHAGLRPGEGAYVEEHGAKNKQQQRYLDHAMGQDRT